jgi:YfiH family protein
METMIALPVDSQTAEAIPLAGTGAPRAFLSLLLAGDMGFGDDENASRRSDWLASLGFDPERSMSPDLVHSRIVVEARSRSDVRGVEADGMVAPGTLERGSSLVITVADCMPIFMYDAGTGACGLLHSGWKGTGILARALSLMSERYGTRASDVSVSLGPRIGACCYVVDEERARVFANDFGSAAVVWHEGRPSLDLVAANVALAEGLGIGSVHVVEGCTFCDDRFGSFRRQGAGHFTRMAAALGHVMSPRP